MAEKWREVLPGLEVSSLGRVRKYLDGYLDADGYLQISGGRRGATALKVHHLVALAFLGPRPEGSVVRHLNDDRADNRLENLRYGTRADNYLDAEINGLIDRHCPERMARLKEAASRGGAWWRGKKRDGVRGKVVK